MYEILEWLDGKKAIIVGCSSAVISYLVSASVITPELGTLITTVIALVFGGAVVATNQVLGSFKYRSK